MLGVHHSTKKRQKPFNLWNDWVSESFLQELQQHGFIMSNYAGLSFAPYQKRCDGRRSKIRARPFSKNWWMKQSEVWQVDGNCLMKLWISSVWAWSSIAATGTNLNNLYPPERELAATFFERKKAQIPFIVIKVALWEVNEFCLISMDLSRLAWNQW